MILKVSQITRKNSKSLLKVKINILFFLTIRTNLTTSFAKSAFPRLEI